ncbi:MAG: hypothetical protein RR379_10665 [Clostridia bacterium]
MPACKKLLSLAITLVVLFGSCASAISVDSDTILDYLYKEKIHSSFMDCDYTFHNNMYIYDIFESDSCFTQATADPNSDEHLLWESVKESWLKIGTECRAILDKEGRTNESVLISVIYDIGSSPNRVCLPLLIIEDDAVIFDISDTVQLAQ